MQDKKDIKNYDRWAGVATEKVIKLPKKKKKSISKNKKGTT